ncbi:MAG: glycosyltransferase [Defluviicoccus sp.]
MLVPLSLHIVHPFLARWQGRSGRSYEFAVMRAELVTVDVPTVFLLVRLERGQPVVLYAGHAERFRPASAALQPIWLAARQRGMTNLHLSFEMIWESARAAEVADLVDALAPELNTSPPVADKLPRPMAVQASAGPDKKRLSPAMPAAATVELSSSSEKPRPAALPVTAVAPRPSRLARWISQLFLARNSGMPTAPRAETILPASPTPAPAPLPSWPERKVVPGMDSTAVPLTASFVGIAAPRDARLATPADRPSAAAPAQREHLGLDPLAPVILFVDGMSTESGISILAEAIVTVGATDPRPVFVLAGSGGEQARTQVRLEAAGLAHRCRLPGDIDAAACADYLAACDFLVVPAHSPASPALAEQAIALGKPVLTTHQAALAAVRHGENGLIAYDNPNSLVWGLREGIARWTRPDDRSGETRRAA